MRALVLAAGLGTRLQPLTLARAKAAAPVDGEPLVRRTIGWLVRQGLTDLVLNLHHKPETITAVVGDGSDLGARVRYSWESPVLGSAGGPRHALPLLLDPPSPHGGSGAASPAERNDGGLVAPKPRTGEGGTCVLVNGDTLTTVDLRAMIEQHRRSGAAVTMALIPNPRPEKYGSVQLDDDHAVTAFTRRGTQGFHFIGPQVIEAAAFMSLPDGVPSETVLGLYPQLIAERRGSVMGFVSG
ncbi:MAG TPA: nucleotidyltransferase family protein, partial [Vicinamibacterales bacterium]|nr:nucleotidyltransferase family protein [Vicinamibacterales bacterium]